MAAKRAQKAKSKPQSKFPEAKRDAKGRLQPGSSGNPGGLPQWRRELTAALQEDAHRAREVLREVLDDVGADPQHRIQAASVVLRYTVPTPKHQLEVSGSVSAISQLDTETLLRIASGG